MDASRAQILQILKDVDLEMMPGIEEKIMEYFVELFKVYIGPLSYNSFVMMMNAAQRKLSRNTMARFEDCFAKSVLLGRRVRTDES